MCIYIHGMPVTDGLGYLMSYESSSCIDTFC